MDGPVAPGESRFCQAAFPNPADAPSIVFNHMQSRQDMQDMIDGIGLARTLVSQSAWDEYRREELTPGPDVTSDSDIEAFVRQATGTSYHPSGTCRMGVDANAVVDGDGRLNGIRRLRVVDASIMPKVITGNLNAPVMMMAEKMSDRILSKTPLPPSRAALRPGGRWVGALLTGTINRPTQPSRRVPTPSRPRCNGRARSHGDSSHRLFGMDARLRHRRRWAAARSMSRSARRTGRTS